MIRQVVFCDICGTEKQQTNHWFVAYNQGGELRVKGWNPSERLHAGARHLCGQNCVHKLLDEFLVLTAAQRSQPAPVSQSVQKEEAPRIAVQGISIAADAGIDEYESSARLITLPETPSAGPAFHKARYTTHPLRRATG